MLMLNQLVLVKIEKASGGNLKQSLILNQGIDKENSQKIIKFLKDKKLKIQVSIQGDQLEYLEKKEMIYKLQYQILKELEISIPLNLYKF